MWVVDKQDVGTAPRDARAYASREVGATLPGLPAVGGFGVRSQGDGRVDAGEFVSGDDVPNIASEFVSQIIAVGTTTEGQR